MAECHDKDKCKYRLLQKVIDAGFTNFKFEDGTIQDKTLVKITIEVAGEKTTLTL